MPREDVSNALREAALRRNEREVINLLDQGADINTSWNDGANEVNTLSFFENNRQSQQHILVAAAMVQTNKGEDWNRFVSDGNVKSAMLSGMPSEEAQFLCVISPRLESKFILPSLRFSSREEQKGWRNLLFGEGVSQRYRENMAIGGMAGLAANMRNVSTFLAVTLDEEGLCDKIIQNFDEKNPDQLLDQNRVRYLKTFRSGLAVDFDDERGDNYGLPVAVIHELVFGDGLQRYFETGVVSTELSGKFSQEVLEEALKVHASHTAPPTRVNTPDVVQLQSDRGERLVRS